jgi:hypothetical protein
LRGAALGSDGFHVQLSASSFAIGRRLEVWSPALLGNCLAERILEEISFEGLCEIEGEQRHFRPF